ncbi:hypothetical protein GALL_330250 [mine drainage metagenome]|uniref:Uncharacterized protein n=1 Tax=mine drainage metagenome TaxID=410659 RepID=A0A1J5R5Z0_9ZZZZ
MNPQTHEDHAEHAQAAFTLAIDATDPMERSEMLSLAGYHAAMADYRLSQKISAQLPARA